MKRILAGTCLVLTGIAGTLIYVHDNWTGGSTTLHPASAAAPAPPETATDPTTTDPSSTTVTTAPVVQQELNDHESRISHLENTTTTTVGPTTTTTTLTKKDSPVIPMDPTTTLTTSDPTTTTTTPKTWVEIARFTAPVENSQRPADSLAVHLETGVLRVTMRPLAWTPIMQSRSVLWIDGDGNTPSSETCSPGDSEVAPGDHALYLGVSTRNTAGAWYGPSSDQYTQMGDVVVEELR